MAVFRFRAAAALAVRRKQEDAAQLLLARAEAVLAEAQAATAQARARIEDASRALAETTSRGAAGHLVGWHRNWIVALAHAADECGRQVEAHASTAYQARQVWQSARRRRMTLDRLRERAWQRYRQEEHRREQKELDELARTRFVAASRDSERSSR